MRKANINKECTEADREKIEGLIGGVRGFGNPGGGCPTVQAAESIKRAQEKARERAREKFHIGKDRTLSNPRT
ncbi:MAG: hypothetical protein HY897_14715 [Deltaproteobacteria bacterium]|nr:hypothetical protein [Deltaproteobacteria bacterium]